MEWGCEDERLARVDEHCRYKDTCPIFSRLHVRYMHKVSIFDAVLSVKRRSAAIFVAIFKLPNQINLVDNAQDRTMGLCQGGAGGKGLEAVDTDLFKGQNLKQEQEARVLRRLIWTFFKAENLKQEQAERVLRQSIGSRCPLKRSGNKHHGAEIVFGFTCGHSRTKSQGGAG